MVSVDREAEPIVSGAFPGSEFFLLWGTPDGGAVVSPEPREPRLLPFFPGVGGTRFLITRFPPEDVTVWPRQDDALLGADVAEKLPGLLEVFESDSPGMHTTDSVDYGVCLEGELHLELDNGCEVRITPGTCVVQQGTRHAWRNRSDRPALMCFVVIGCERQS